MRREIHWHSTYSTVSTGATFITTCSAAATDRGALRTLGTDAEPPMTSSGYRRWQRPRMLRSKTSSPPITRSALNKFVDYAIGAETDWTGRTIASVESGLNQR